MNLHLDIAAGRPQLEWYLKTVTAKHLRPSGYRTGPIGHSEPLAVWVPRNAKGEPTMQSFDIQGFMLDSFMGFTTTGVIIDCEGGGMVTLDYSELPVEDLLRLDAWVAQAQDSGLFPNSSTTPGAHCPAV